MTENIEQASVPNYIAQAEAGVKKYYPQFEEYFKPIFTRTYKLSTSSQNIINTKVQENFELFDEELPSEKDSYSHWDYSHWDRYLGMTAAMTQIPHGCSQWKELYFGRINDKLAPKNGATLTLNLQKTGNYKYYRIECSGNAIDYSLAEFKFNY